MRVQKIRRKRRYRWLAGLFCVSLLFGEIMSTGLVVSAQEPVPELQDSRLQENSGEDESEKQESGGKESGNGAEQTPGGEGTEEEQTPVDAEIVEEKEPGGGEAEDDTEQEPGVEETGEQQEPDHGNDAEEEDIPDSGDGEPTVSENTLSENTQEESGLSLLAAGNDIAGGSYGKVTWVIHANGELIVEGEGEFAPKDERAPWYEKNLYIKSAKIRLSGVTDLSAMFAGCSNMTSVDLSELQTDAVTDMSHMFQFCHNLSELDASGFNTANVTDMSYMFNSCYSLRKLNVSGFNTANVTDMTSMFCWCAALTQLDLSHFDTRNVTNLEDMFYQCKALTQLDVSHFDTQNVTDMSGMFYHCEALTRLDVSGFDTSKVVNINHMFDSCLRLTELDVSGFDTSRVTNMQGMFQQCEALTQLDVSRFDTHLAGDIAFMFSGCKNLKELDLRNFKTYNAMWIDGMFAKCENLVELDLSSFEIPRITSLGCIIIDEQYGMFTGCKKLERIDVSSFDTSNVVTMIGLFDGCESLKELDLSNFDMGKIANEADCQFFLRNCKKLETFYVPRSVKVDVLLPKEKESDVWRGIIDGEQKELTEMPKGLSDSVLLMKNKDRLQVEERIVAKKGKTLYSCGDILLLYDLKVTYYGTTGSVRTLSLKTGEETDGYTTNEENIDMSTPGEKTLTVAYEGESKPLTAEVKLRVVYEITAENTTVTLPGGQSFDYTYIGEPVKPVPTVVCRVSGQEITLEEGTDYTLSYRNNIMASESAPMVIITGKGNYSGKLTKSFAIRKAAPPAAEQILCYSSDCDSAAADRKLELSESFTGYGSKTGYHIVSVTEDDTIAGAVFARIPVDADISSDGILTYSTNAGKPGDFATVKMAVSFTNYEDAELTVKIVLSEENVMYTISYNTMGHGGNGWTEGVRAGSLIEEPESLSESGYLFAGWYTERHLARKWDFAADTVQENITLYAGWLSDRSEGSLQMYIQDIEDMAYTGNALKPTVVVYDSDGETLLKAGKDYTVKYYNNINAGGTEVAGAVAKAVNPGKKNETLTNIVPGRGSEGESALSHNFTKAAPYIAIMGKGNYTETIYKNFCILPAGIGTPGAAPAQGFTLKYADQLVTNGKKEQKPFSSMKYKKAMKAGVDFRVSLEATDALDAEGQAVSTGWKAEGSDTNKQNPAIPKGYSGTFLLTVKGQGNYTGEIRRTVFVGSKEKLIKNASITLGKDQKSRPYTGQAVTLTDFQVKAGKTHLSIEQDYTVSYADNVAVGTATMTITGKNGYVGSKSVTFKITGEKFTAGNILVKSFDTNNPNENDFKSSMPYTGSAVLQNKVTLATKATAANPNPKQLVYGTHYTIGYKNNVKKGTATMIFTAKPGSGYSGSFKKTFKITAQTLAQENLIVQKAADSAEVQATYRKNGAVPSFVLKNAAGVVLTQGKDYTIKCKNNMAVTTTQTPENKKPIMTITGKGNYTGNVEMPFKVVQESLETAIDSGIVQVSCTSVMKKEGMQFKDLKFKLMEGKKTLAVGETKDYTLDETNCTPEKLLAYAAALETGTASSQTEPSVIIRGTGINYTGTKTLPLGGYLYAGKLDNRNLYVVVSEGKGQNVYTGKQLMPTVAVYYGEAKAVSDAKKAKEKDGAVLTAANGDYQLIRLTENADYTLVYGVNTVAGKNKGSVKVTGAGKYGGSVTVKFTIEKKPVCTETI